MRTRCAYLIRFSLPMNVRQISRYAGKENKRKPQRNKVCIVTKKRISIGKTHFINKQLKYTNISVFLVYLLVPLLVLICSLMCCVCVFFSFVLKYPSRTAVAQIQIEEITLVDLLMHSNLLAVNLLFASHS